MKNTMTAKTPETAKTETATTVNATPETATPATPATPETPTETAAKIATAKSAKPRAAKTPAAKTETAPSLKTLETAEKSIKDKAAETPTAKSVKEQSGDIIAEYKAATPTPTPSEFWSFMNAHKYPLAINGKMLLNLGGYTTETRAELYKVVIRFRRALLVFMQARDRAAETPTRKNKEALRAAIVAAYADYDALRAAVGISEPHEIHCLDWYADQSLKIARLDRSDICKGYKFNSVSETALLNLVLKYYSTNYESNMEYIQTRLEKRAAALAKQAATETPAETPAK